MEGGTRGETEDCSGNKKDTKEKAGEHLQKKKKKQKEKGKEK